MTSSVSFAGITKFNTKDSAYLNALQECTHTMEYARIAPHPASTALILLLARPVWITHSCWSAVQSVSWAKYAHLVSIASPTPVTAMVDALPDFITGMTELVMTKAVTWMSTKVLICFATLGVPMDSKPIKHTNANHVQDLIAKWDYFTTWYLT